MGAATSVRMPGAVHGSDKNFVWTTTKVMSRHVIERCRTGNLFTLSESKLALKHLLMLIVAEAKTDFEQMIYLDTHYRNTVLPGQVKLHDRDGDGELSKEELEGVGPRVPELAPWNVPRL